MQVIIEIPEDEYKFIMAYYGGYQGGCFCVLDAVKDGTPLPKGHGRLIDAEELDRRMYHEAFETDSDLQKWDSGCWIRYKLYENIRDKAPTIIEADKEEEG